MTQTVFYDLEQRLGGADLTFADLQDLYQDYYGKKGAITECMKSIKDMTPEQKATLGKHYNDERGRLLLMLETRMETARLQELEQTLRAETLDMSERVSVTHKGSYHPVTLVEMRLADICHGLGFSVLDGPELEHDFYNFDALNLNSDHPARDLQDTFFMEEDGLLMRTQTSSVQIRAMKRLSPPFAIVAPGKAYRNENIDASHDMVFHQFEGMMIGKSVGLAEMKFVIREILSSLFGYDLEIRLRPSFYPFVEPGQEVDMPCFVCHGDGCRVCKHSGWVTIAGCGVVHETVLRAGGIDPQEYSGFAFGFGTTRLAMMRYALDDIRYLNNPHPDFLKQFQK